MPQRMTGRIPAYSDCGLSGVSSAVCFLVFTVSNGCNTRSRPTRATAPAINVFVAEADDDAGKAAASSVAVSRCIGVWRVE